jgi:hypothetical protein
MGNKISATRDKKYFLEKPCIILHMKRKIAELATTDISGLFLSAERQAAPERPLARRRRGRFPVVPVAACATVMAVGMAALPVAFVAVDHTRVVAWTNRLFDLAGL